MSRSGADEPLGSAIVIISGALLSDNVHTSSGLSQSHSFVDVEARDLAERFLRPANAEIWSQRGVKVALMELPYGVRTLNPAHVKALLILLYRNNHK